MRHTSLNTLAKSAAAVAVAGCCLAGSLSAQIRYTLVVPEVFGSEINRTDVHGNEINDNGESLLNRVASFAVWRDGKTTHLVNALSNYPASLSSVKAASINRFQQVVGNKTYLRRGASGSRFDTFPFYWDPHNGLVDLDDIGGRSPAGAGSTLLYGINEQGVAIGVSQNYLHETPSGNVAFAWSFEVGRQDIAPLSEIEGKSFTRPADINGNGDIAGVYRKFEGSYDRYFERGFIKLANGDARDLSDIDSAFFESSHSTVRSLNDKGVFVGELDGSAYVYELETAVGEVIRHPRLTSGKTKAHAINNLNIVAGNLETSDDSGNLGLSPFLWTRETGLVELQAHIKDSLASLLPEGVDVRSARITPKAINARGHISASLETQSEFAREIILQPTLEFEWSSMEQTVMDGVPGVLYLHEKSSVAAGAIPAESLGYEIAFECSSDLKSWNPVETSEAGVRIAETETTIEVFLPFSDCLFVRPTLKEPSEF